MYNIHDNAYSTYKTTLKCPILQYNQNVVDAFQHQTECN